MSGLLFRQKLFQSPKTGSARFIYLLAKIGLSVSICILCLGSAIISGFTSAVEQKLTQFLGDARISAYGYSTGDNTKTVDIDSVSSVLGPETSFLPYTEQAAIVFTDSALFQAVQLLGVPTEVVEKQWKSQLLSGRMPRFQESEVVEICISNLSLTKLNVEIGDTIRAQFADTKLNRVRNRNCVIVGILSTGVSEFNGLAIWPIEHAQTMLQLTNRAHHIALFDPEIQIEDIADQLPFNIQIVSIKNVYPNIFQWLDLQASNESVIGIIIAIVAFFNCMSIVYVLVVERRTSIAIFRIHGASAKWIAMAMYATLFRLFAQSICIGMSAACLIALSLQYGKWIPLDETTYYIKYVPAQIILWKWCVYGISSFILILPAAYLPFRRFIHIELDILASQNTGTL